MSFVGWGNTGGARAIEQLRAVAVEYSPGPIDRGWDVLDFWHSRNAFDRFAKSRLLPAAAEPGDHAFPEPPDIKGFPIHSYTTPAL